MEERVNRTVLRIFPFAAALAVSLLMPVLSVSARDTSVPDGQVVPKTRIMGRSVKGRAIEAYLFERPREDESVSVVIYGGIHGGYEWNTVLLVKRLIDHFRVHPEDIPEGCRIYLIPVVNPDGLHRITGGTPVGEHDFSSAFLEDGRFNANGVDLNRNWDNRWKPDAYWRSRSVNAGEKPFSEPETRALRDFVSEVEPELVISYHSAANGIYYAGKHYSWEPARRFAEAYSEASGYPIPRGSLVGYRITGASTGYFYSKRIPAMVVELAGREGPEFEKNLRGLKAVLPLCAEKEEKN